MMLMVKGRYVRLVCLFSTTFRAICSQPTSDPPPFPKGFPHLTLKSFQQVISSVTLAQTLWTSPTTLSICSSRLNPDTPLPGRRVAVLLSPQSQPHRPTSNLQPPHSLQICPYAAILLLSRSPVGTVLKIKSIPGHKHASAEVCALLTFTL